MKFDLNLRKQFEDFEPVAKKVARFLSDIDFIGPEKSQKILLTEIIHKKAHFSQLLIVNQLLQSAAYNSKGSYRKWISALAQLPFAEMYSRAPYLSPPWDDEDFSNLWGPDVLIEIFKEILGDDFKLRPEKGAVHVQRYLWAVHLFYGRIAQILEKAHPEMLLRIDYAFSLIAFYTGLISKQIDIKGLRDLDRISKSTKKRNKKKAEKIQQAAKLFHTIDDRSEKTPYQVAAEISKKWPLKDVPCKKTIVGYLREENLVR